jgi:hypothetical protein
MPSPNALAGYLCRSPLVAAVSYSSEMQQVIKIYDQIDVNETATKFNADFWKTFTSHFFYQSQTRALFHCSLPTIQEKKKAHSLP